MIFISACNKGANSIESILFIYKLLMIIKGSVRNTWLHDIIFQTTPRHLLMEERDTNQCDLHIDYIYAILNDPPIFRKSFVF